MNIYSGLFLKDDMHVTYHFEPPNPYLPDEIREGDAAIVDMLGIIIKKEFVVIQCRIICTARTAVLHTDGRYIGDDPLDHPHSVLEYQHDSDIPLHITAYTNEKTKPVKTGRYLRNHQDEVIKFDVEEHKSYGLYQRTGTWGYHSINSKHIYIEKETI